MTDAEGSITRYTYGSLQRLTRITYPDPDGDPFDLSDYDEFTYDLAGNVTQFRRRDASTIATTYDNLNRPTLMDVSSGADVTTAYDNFGRVTATSFSGHSLAYAYDQLSRLTSETGPQGAVSYQYDLASRRTRMDWPGAGSFYVTYDTNLYNEVAAIREQGAGSGPGVLAVFAYDNLGRRTTLTRGNGVVTTYGYDAASRLTSLASDLASTGSDDSRTFSYNSAFQIMSRTLSDNDYAQSFAVGGAFYEANDLNQYARINNGTQTFDARGNLTNDGTNAYGYDIHNRLTSRGANTLSYDPAGRLYQTVGGGVTTRMLYDGVALIAEYNGSDALQRRYVQGPGIDEPIVWYEGTGTSDRRWLITDERGSISAVTNGSGAATNINTYDEFGVPGPSNAGRFQYTGQQLIAEAGVYHYRARAYSAEAGRFMQSDPVGTSGGINLYAYVGNDPTNYTDAFGLCGPWVDLIVWTATYPDGKVESYTEIVGYGNDPCEINISGGGGIHAGGSIGGLGSSEVEGLTLIQYVDRCASYATPLRPGTDPGFSVNDRTLDTVAQAKFTQHSFPFNVHGQPQSVFFGSILSGQELAAATVVIMSTNTYVDSWGGRVRITANTGRTVGVDFRTPGRTTYLTAIFSPPVGQENGIDVRVPISMFPGCP